MEKIRSPFQGVWNVVRFNWHFYALSGFVLLILFFAGNYLSEPFHLLSRLLFFLALVAVLISLIATFYVYDLSDLYKLTWLNELKENEKPTIVNINAGFDETSVLFENKFKNAEMFVFDFYDPRKHTEVSIRRARKAYPPYPNTRQVSTIHIPLADDFADNIFAILSVHEIRDENERLEFFKELRRILKPHGQIAVTEHLRDTANFVAYNIGFFHFHSKSSWLKTFQSSGLKIVREIKITPFISTFVLEKI